MIIRLSPLGIKWETQMADGFDDLQKRELIIYNDQTRRYCLKTAADVSGQAESSSVLERHAAESRGWKFTEWKKAGTDKIIGFKANVYTRTRTKPGAIRFDDKIWISCDPRLERYRGGAGDILSLASRTKLPETGLPLRRQAVMTDLRHYAEHIVPVPKEKSGEDPLALLGPPPGESDRPSVSKSTTSTPSKVHPKIKRDDNELGEGVEYSVVHATMEKTDPSRFTAPKGYTRVKNLSDVLDLGGLDGTLSF
jgi:hypothetical protein